MTTSMYCLYVGFDYTYIDINALVFGLTSLVSSRCWGSNLWPRFARNYQSATLTIRSLRHPCMYALHVCMLPMDKIVHTQTSDIDRATQCLLADKQSISCCHLNG